MPQWLLAFKINLYILFLKNLVNFKICKFSCHLGFCEADHQEGCKSLAVSIFRVPHPRVICFNFTQFNLYFTPSPFSFNSYVLCIRKADKCPQLDCEWLQLVRALWRQNLRGCSTKQSHKRCLKKFFLQKSRFTTAFYLMFFVLDFAYVEDVSRCTFFNWKLLCLKNIRFVLQVINFTWN